MKKTLLSLISAVLFTGCINTNIERDLKRELVYSPAVVPNPRNDVRYYSFKSESEGINDLRNSLVNAKKEEAYMFIPSQNLWVEIGFNEKATNPLKKNRRTLFINGAVIDNYALTNTQVHFWHTHLPREKRDNILNSISDLETFSDLSRGLTRLNPSLVLRDGVVSEFGESYIIINNPSYPFKFEKEKRKSGSNEDYFGMRELFYIFSEELKLKEFRNLHDSINSGEIKLDAPLKKDIYGDAATIYFNPKK